MRLHSLACQQLCHEQRVSSSNKLAWQNGTQADGMCQQSHKRHCGARQRHPVILASVLPTRLYSKASTDAQVQIAMTSVEP